MYHKRGKIHLRLRKGVVLMPRCARVKSYDSIYHIMVRSISDVPLFRENEDKDRYLNYIIKYQKKFKFKVYAYCLMTTHAHFIIDGNGADISKIMHGINQCYAQYFNIKYKRHGHVFQDRFKSKIIDTDEYLLTLSAYIHNNPTDIKKFKASPEDFKYSTLGVYLGLRDDSYNIVDEGFVMGLFSGNVKKAREDYYVLVMLANNENFKRHVEFKDEKSQYRSERVVIKRDFKPENIMEFIEKYMGIERKIIRRKYSKKATKSKAISVLLMRCYCDYSFKQICEVLGRLTLSRVSKLCEIGYELAEKDEKYKNILEEFLKYKAA